jgi:hypothetical protein
METTNGQKHLKIGILMHNIETLQNWECRILDGILDDPRLELRLFIKDGRSNINTLGKRLKHSLFTLKIFSNLLYSIQYRIESYIFKPKHTVDTKEIMNLVRNIETIYVNPTRKGFLDIFSKEDSETICSYDLDIILRHEFGIIRGNILNAAKHGIWSYHHADNAINRGGPANFWEIVNNEPYCGTTLQRLTPELDGGLIIDKAYFNWFWSFYKSYNDILEKSVVLLFKNINRLLEQGNIETKKSLTYYNRLYKKPTLKYILLYMVKFYGNIFGIIGNKICFRGRSNCWSLFIGKGKFLESTLYKIQPVVMPRGVFWADPFLYVYNGSLYVFFENYSYKTKRGKISVGKVLDDKGSYKILDIKDVLNCSYHLSYPQIIEEDGMLYLLPETYQNKRLELYRCINFPDKWELYSTAFEGDEVVDTTYFRDKNNQRWLFLNKGYSRDSELYIYRIDNLKFENIQEHKQNPIYIDCRKARNGGAIFKDDNNCYRPNQICTHGIYGRGLQISKIKKLNIDEYEEEAVISIEPNFQKGLIGIHHLHQIENYFVYDGCYKRR